MSIFCGCLCFFLIARSKVFLSFPLQMIEKKKDFALHLAVTMSFYSVSLDLPWFLMKKKEERLFQNCFLFLKSSTSCKLQLHRDFLSSRCSQLRLRIKYFKIKFRDTLFREIFVAAILVLEKGSGRKWKAGNQQKSSLNLLKDVSYYEVLIWVDFSSFM